MRTMPKGAGRTLSAPRGGYVEGAALKLPPGWRFHPGPRPLRMYGNGYCRQRPAGAAWTNNAQQRTARTGVVTNLGCMNPRSRAASEAGPPVRKAHREKQRAGRKMSLLIFSAALCFSSPGNALCISPALQRHAVIFLRFSPSAAVGSRGIIPLAGPGAKAPAFSLLPGNGTVISPASIHKRRKDFS